MLIEITHGDLDGDLHGIRAWPATGAHLKVHSDGGDESHGD
jgi:hypothetical protein